MQHLVFFEPIRRGTLDVTWSAVYSYVMCPRHMHSLPILHRRTTTSHSTCLLLFKTVTGSKLRSDQMKSLLMRSEFAVDSREFTLRISIDVASAHLKGSCRDLPEATYVPHPNSWCGQLVLMVRTVISLSFLIDTLTLTDKVTTVDTNRSLSTWLSSSMPSHSPQCIQHH